MAATGRQVQLITEEIQRQERMNALLRRAIAEAESPRRLGEGAERLGYELGTPVYISLDRPLGEASSGPSLGMLDSGRAEAPPRAMDPTVEALSSLFSSQVEIGRSP
jgi:hypothetical protein